MVVNGLQRARPGTAVAPQRSTAEALPRHAEHAVGHGGLIAGSHTVSSRFFIDRPIFAAVISLLIVIAGAVAYALPVAQYPDITPPVIYVQASYPGASAQVVADTVASPIEQEVNGVEGMLYMQSTSSSDGSYGLTITFEVGTDPDMASVLVQNRVNVALAKPARRGRSARGCRRAVDGLARPLMVGLISPGNVYDDLFLGNYATPEHPRRAVAHRGRRRRRDVPHREYGMRLWLDPELPRRAT